MSALLVVEDLRFSYGEVQVLHGLDLTVETGKISCVMGRNGVGKTTLLRNVVGLETPHCGRILLDGKDFTLRPANERAAAGIGYVPQGRQIFPRLTVEENLKVALEAAVVKGRPVVPDEIYALFPILWEMRRRRGGDLSGGQQQQLAISRALATNPKILVLDEPTEGIQPNVITEIGKIIRQLVEELNLGVLLVEQYVDFVRDVADDFRVMNRGRFVAEGPTTELNDSLIHRHLSI
ncbi:MAG: urea ABC transporter ATP-binding subunit UrtE [Opitutales bacterium]|jgi:urea transport system ATP-binding protein